MRMEQEEACRLFKALGDETRLCILGLLGSEEVCGCEILERVDISQPTLSHHMKILMACGLVKGRKDGAWMRYTLNGECITQMQGYLQGIKAAGAPADCGKDT